MNFAIVVSDDAENDLDEAFLWYEGQSLALQNLVFPYSE